MEDKDNAEERDENTWEICVQFFMSQCRMQGIWDLDSACTIIGCGPSPLEDCMMGCAGDNVCKHYCDNEAPYFEKCMYWWNVFDDCREREW